MVYIKYIITSIGLMGFLNGNPSVHEVVENSISGIQFFTRYDENPITSLKIPAESYLSFGDGFRLEFDLRIREKNPFGYILSMSTQNMQDLLVLTYINFRNPDTSYIELSLQNNPFLITLPFPNELIGRSVWHHLEMVFEKDFIQLTLNDSISDSATFDPININEYDMIFGGITIKTEPPRMDIREINVMNQEGSGAYWSIDEMTGDVVHDSIGSKHGKVYNGEFLAGRHEKLHLIKSLPHDLYRLKSFFIDQDDLFLLFLMDDSLYKLNIQTWEIATVIPFNKVPKKHILMYDDHQNQFFLFHNGGDLPVYTFDWETGSWSGLDLSLESEGQYYDGKRVYIPETKEFYSFGGYGWYTYKNNIFKYSLSDKIWIKIQPKLRKNKIFAPRYPKYVYSFKDKIFIIGGHGSESGKQETGTQYYFDIWAFDRKTDSLYLVAEKGFHPRLNEVIGFEIWEEQNIAFELIRIELDSTFTYYLNVFDFPHGNKLEFSLNFEDYFDLSNEPFTLMKIIEKTSELLFVCYGELNGDSNQKGIHFFTLALPLVNQKEPIESKDDRLVYFILLMVLFSGALWAFYRRKEIVPQDLPEIQSEQVQFTILDKGVSVQLFGLFRMWKDGKEILYKDWQSKKSRELFIYLILKNNHGVTGKEISLTFWPNVDSDSAVNSRGVAIARIRKTLGEYGNHLIYKENRYFVNYNEFFLSDYRIIQSWVQQNNESNIAKYINIFGANGLLPEMRGDWVENIKTDVHHSFIGHLKKQVSRLKNDVKWDDLVLIGESILSLNPLDDEALVIYVNALKQAGKQGLAHQVYTKFAQHYEKEMDEQYELKYESI